MNLFVLDRSALLAAEYHHDVHVRKMLVETAQILSTALRGCVSHVQAARLGLYETTHVHHTCVRWAGATRGNFGWTISLLDALIREYDHRWPGRGDRYERPRRLLAVYSRHVAALPPGGLQDFARTRAVQEICAGSQIDTVAAYRVLYATEKMTDKNGRRLDRWTRRERPWWLAGAMLIADCTRAPEEGLDS